MFKDNYVRYQVPGATDYSPHGPKTATAGKRMADPKVPPNRLKITFTVFLEDEIKPYNLNYYRRSPDKVLLTRRWSKLIRI